MNAKEVLRAYLSSILVVKERMSLKTEIVEKCSINYPTLNNWLYGATKIPPLAQEKIEEIIGKKIFADEKIIISVKL